MSIDSAERTFDTVLWDEPEPGIIVITLNRPPMNAVNLPMLAEIDRIIDIAHEDESIRVLIFTGSGARAFSAGADMGNFTSEFDAGPQPPNFFRHGNKISLIRLEKLAKPVISAINGVAVGEGFEIAMASDFRIAARSARIGFPEANIGLIPASGGCSRIVKLVGLAKAKEMVLYGDLMPAEEAYRQGLLFKVVNDEELLAEAVKLGQHLARKAPLALGMAKLVLAACADADMATSHTLEMISQTVLMNTQDHNNGVQSFLNKEKPTFTGR
ncbi:MAG TPA: enoyl-CoA hydratase/isomerase family protein [Streptosporangiaceae bacterium]|jgi:enoyl-CoA hydratase